MTAPSASDEYFLDPLLVRRRFDRASKTFDDASGVHAEIRTRLLERLDVVRLDPKVVIDLGAATGHATRALQDRYRSAYVLAVDSSTDMLRAARQQQRFFKRFGRATSDAQQLGIKSASVDLLFSNLMLQWCSNPDAAFAEMARVMRPQGLITFTSLGPDSLRELRAAWGGDHVHVHRFIDMHDLGDALMRAGFAEPVMDTERLTITYRDLNALMRELRLSGSANSAAGRSRALHTPRELAGVRSAYRFHAPEAIAATLEVVYGHAWAVGPRATRQAGSETMIPVGAIKRFKR